MIHNSIPFVLEILVQPFSKIARHPVQRLSLRYRMPEMLLQLRITRIHVRRVALHELLRRDAEHRASNIHWVAKRAVIVLEDSACTDWCCGQERDDRAQHSVQSCGGDVSTVRLFEHALVDSKRHLTIYDDCSDPDELVQPAAINFAQTELMGLSGVVHGANADCPSAEGADHRRRDGKGGVRAESFRPPGVDEKPECDPTDDPCSDENSVKDSFHWIFASAASLVHKYINREVLRRIFPWRIWSARATGHRFLPQWAIATSPNRHSMAFITQHNTFVQRLDAEILGIDHG